MIALFKQNGEVVGVQMGADFIVVAEPFQRGGEGQQELVAGVVAIGVIDKFRFNYLILKNH